MTETYCGENCELCPDRRQCVGCKETCGNPFGSGCIAAAYIKVGGSEGFKEFKSKLIDEVNALNIEGMPKINRLFCLRGSFVNLEYTLPSGNKVKLLDDNRVYLGCQTECIFDASKCFGVVADTGFIAVSTYGEDGVNPELVLYTRR